MSDPTSAIVIGGSMAGLLAARALSDHFDQVTIIERDQLPDEPVYRNGVPQARHLHALLARGQQIMDILFPGFTDDLTAAGCTPIELGRDSVFVTTGGTTQRFNSGITGNICARVELEALVRRRVHAIANIQFMTEWDVQGLLASKDHKTVTGVQIESRTDHTAQDLSADLVVDASGRGSKAPEWLVSLGYDAPAESTIDAHCGYASRWYEIPENPAFRGALIAIQPRAAQKLYRGGGLLKVDERRWVVTLLGANGDYPPTDEAEFMDYAKSLSSSIIYDCIKDAKPITQIYGYRKLENRHRHFERLTRRPENFIVTGDAACAFNPIYGQGMTTAAMDAQMLGKLLSSYDVRQLSGFAADFQKRLAKLAVNPWLMSVTEDLRYPDVVGDATLMHRFSQRYFDLVANAMPYDNAVTTSFYEALNMIKPPTSMMRPAIVWRVLYHILIRHSPDAQLKLTTAEWSAIKP